MVGLAIANGAVRDIVYRARVGDRVAHQISTVILLLLLGGYFWGLFTAWPLASVRQAWEVAVGVKEVVASAMYCCLSCGPPERMVFQG